jgi:hypothetical protein
MSGTRWRSWLRHCAKRRKVAGSIPDGVIEIWHSLNPSCRITGLGLTEALTEGRSVRRADKMPPSCADCVEILGASNPCPTRPV